eukprot:gb/GECH01008267.1/.p1 GENE.gb/GECH01008267.1/~~gb/GECH01008267.1/.p1  ORF type:complete len:410 (+),score=84.75 gb/GECH01008267.1/:1-1230(+)
MRYPSPLTRVPAGCTVRTPITQARRRSSSPGHQHPYIQTHAQCIRPTNMTPLISYYTSNHIPGNYPSEDTHAALAGSKGSLFGVFDGHGGQSTSQYLHDVLLPFIDLHLKTPRTERIPERIKSAFRLVDRMFFRTRWNTDQAAEVYPGSCACVAYITDTGYAYVANAGDSGACIGFRTVDGQWMPRAVARRHTLDNLTEHRALLASHPNEPDVDAFDRVKGVLQPTRAFGNGRLKFKEINALHPEPLPEPFTPPYIHAEPDVTRIQIHPHRDRFLLLATDGLWDLIAPPSVVSVIGEHMELPGVNLASVAVHAALSNVGMDWNLERMAEVPREGRRGIHDDITAMVIVFRDGKGGEGRDGCGETAVRTTEEERGRQGREYGEVFAAAEDEMEMEKETGARRRRRVRMRT